MTVGDTSEAEHFRTQGHAVIDLAADYLAAAFQGTLPVLPWREPDQAVDAYATSFSDEQPLVPLLHRVLTESVHVHHPRCVGHQVAAVLPDAALTELLNALLANGMAVYEMGPTSVPMERAVVRWMCSQLGFDANSDGILTGGGSTGNLTALLAARQDRAGFDVWKDGAHGGPPLTVLASDQAHYSVRRTVQIMGWGHLGVATVPTDSAYRMDPAALATTLQAAKNAGRRVVALVASAGSTATGSFDPLEPLGSFCKEHGLWFHVDGAHGASVLLSSKHRSLLKGIERADSVVWDGHKLMMLPSLVTGVLFREKRRSYEAFSQQASYLYEGMDPEAEWYNLGTRTLECTKRMMGVTAYVALASRGTQFFAAHVDAMFERAARFAKLLEAQPDFELATFPQCNIVCFRYCPQGVEDLDDLQVRLRKAIVKSGEFYLVQTRLQQGVFLRTTLLNPHTTDQDLEALVETIRRSKRS
jgi:L-2,4-diaminobutyrate decarboxylase